MNKVIKYIFISLGIVLLGGWLYFQFIKKRVIRNALENAISKKTDDIYFIKYDSSVIDELSGSARFFNVVLQSDSLELQLSSGDSTGGAVFNIRVAEVGVYGVNIPGLINNEKIKASSIELIRPSIDIIQPDSTGKPGFSSKDSLALYEKILGKFESIQAAEVRVKEGNIRVFKKSDQPGIAISGINLLVKNILIDSTRDYSNIASYFIRDASVLIDSAIIDAGKDAGQLKLKAFEYDAEKQLIRLQRFQQTDGRQKEIFDLSRNMITGVNTDSFILRNQLRADKFESSGGLVSIYLKKKEKDAGDINVSIPDNNYFTEVSVKKISLGKTNIMLYGEQDKANPALILRDIEFNASEIQNLDLYTDIRNLLVTSQWVLSGSGCTLKTKDKIYELIIGPFKVDNKAGTVVIGQCQLKPMISETAFARQLKLQEDLYAFTFRNIRLKDLDIGSLLFAKELRADELYMEPVLRVFNDRTVPPNPGSKVGKYPHQQIQQLSLPVYIRKMQLEKGLIAYKERGEKSKMTGTVFFTNVRGTVSNITNIKSQVSKNNMLTVLAHARFMGASELVTKWMLPLNTTTGEFSMTGYAGAFDATTLNQITEPLGMASIENGRINKLDFSIYGTDYLSKGSAALLYNDLKIGLLKKDSNELIRKGLVSALANILIKDNNPSNGITRKGNIAFTRDTTKSFFNLAWKSIFSAAKRITSGKNDD